MSVDARPGPGVAGVFARYGEEYRRSHTLPSLHENVMRSIEQCRTPALGGHTDQCDVCGTQYTVWNSCNDPHCPTCGSMKRAQWLDERRAELLPTPYFHVVFTFDHGINVLAGWNQKFIYNLLFSATAETLQEFAHRKGGVLGITAMLHTWDQKLQRHLHVHCLVPAGMLSLDHERWIPFEGRFLFPVKALGRVFRGKVVEALRSANAKGRLALPPDIASAVPGHDLPALLRRLHNNDWVVYSQPPMGGPDAVLQYLARYAYRVAISNNRIKSVADGTVAFEYKDRKDGDQVKTLTLPAEDFIGRFLLHVLPLSFRRIRHYGLFANRWKKDLLARCFELLKQPRPSKPEKRSARTLMLELTGTDIAKCPRCKTGILFTVLRIPPLDALDSLPSVLPTEAPNSS